MRWQLFWIGTALCALRIAGLIDWHWLIVTAPWWIVVLVFAIKAIEGGYALATQIALWRKATRVE